MSATAASVAGEGRLRGWLAGAHSLPVEIGLVLAFYALYEASRGLIGNDYRLALRHAEDVAALERRLGIFIEGDVQDAVALLPGLDWLLAHAYVSLHLALTVLALTWLYRWHREWFPLIRTGLVVASVIALFGYALYPTAPPRLAADMGIEDTVYAATGVDLSSKLLSSFYNPYAAMPSMHFGYALIVGLIVSQVSRNRAARLAGALYPAFVLLAIVATGNHFLLDAVAGALVALVGLAVATAVSGLTCGWSGVRHWR
jgi:hypothetical protein